MRDVAAVADVACLSNTNHLHWSDWAGNWPIIELLSTKFLSFQLGLLKPDREIFDHLIASTGFDPERILFLDDNQLNVDSAPNSGPFGWRARTAPAVLPNNSAWF